MRNRPLEPDDAKNAKRASRGSPEPRRGTPHGTWSGKHGTACAKSGRAFWRARHSVTKPIAASAAGEEILERIQRGIGQMEIGPAAIMRIGLTQDQAVLDQQLHPAQP